jgi:uncharacterized protein YkwD
MPKIILISIFSFCFLFLGCSEKNVSKENKLHKEEIVVKEQSFTEATQKKLLVEHNKQREKKGLSPLKMSKELCEYAQNHADIMAKKDSLYHSQISKLMEFDSVSSSGENIAWGQESPESVVEAWMWSPMHRWNILGSSFNKVGFGFTKDKTGRFYWCTVFTN